MWDTDRRSTLPPNWADLRRQVKHRAGGLCEHRDARGIRCVEAGTECHHLGSRVDHSIANLQWICVPHHKAETQAQAKQQQHAQYVTARKRTPEKHPGSL